VPVIVGTFCQSLLWAAVHIVVIIFWLLGVGLSVEYVVERYKAMAESGKSQKPQGGE
jgi:F0F1-type ATP synthase assembly protein I